MTVLAVVIAAFVLLMLVMPGFGPPFIAERRVVVPIARNAHLVGGLGALGLASSSQEGFVTHVGFGMLAVLWLTSTLQAYLRIRAGDQLRHRAAATDTRARPLRFTWSTP